MDLKKVFWVSFIITALMWIGVGVFYLRSVRLSQAPAPSKVPPVLEAIISPQLSPTGVEAADPYTKVEAMVANFQGWEKIKDSQDRYILLTDPATGGSLPRIRVGFELSFLFGYDGGEDITVFAVQKGEDEANYDVLYALKYFSKEEIDKLVKKGDWLKIYFQKEKDKEENRKDTNDYLLAHLLLIKREGGKAEVEQELSRKIERPQEL